MFRRKPKKIDLPAEADGADIICEIVRRREDFALTEAQADALTNAMLELDKTDSIQARSLRLVDRARAVLINWRDCTPHDIKHVIEGVIAEIDALDGFVPGDARGQNKLNAWFGLTHASFLCWPRVMMQQMPDAWQERMADLAKEFATVWSNVPDGVLNFVIRGEGKGGRMAALNSVLTDYRHPDYKTLAKWQRGIIVDFPQFCDAVRTLLPDCADTDIANAMSALPEAPGGVRSEGATWTWEQVEEIVKVLK